MMKRFKTLRVRFALWTASLFLALLAVFSIFVYFRLSASLNASVDNSLAVSAAQVAGGLNVQNGQLIISEALSAEDSGLQALSERGLTVILLTKNGDILQAVGPYRNSAAAISATTPANAQGTYMSLPETTGENDQLRVFLLPVLDNGQTVGWVQVVQSLGPVQDALDQLLTALLIGGSVLLLFAALGGYFLSARALKPIDHITQTARKIAGGEDLTARLNLPDSGDEVGRLASTFDGMLARLDDSFRRERQFTADASHELRTPLTAMQAILSVTRQGKRAPAEYRQALEDLSAETDRMRGLVEDLLRLVRGEKVSDLHPEPLDLSTLLADVADSIRPLAEAKGLTLVCNLPPALPFTGDLDSLIRLFVNLLDNAIKYSEHGGITITAHPAGEELVVDIADTGIGIPPQHLPRIFDRFYRVDPARSTSGVGLGLAIAAQIARTNSGRIEVHSTPGAGSTFSIFLPNR